MKQTGDIEHFLVLEIGDESRAQRILVRMLRLGEAPQVADHHQDVLVHRVDVEEVVLHLSNDPAERRQVLAQNAEQVHAAELVRQTAWLAEHLQKARAIRGIAPKCDVDPMPFAPERPQRTRGHSGELGVPL